MSRLCFGGCIPSCGLPTFDQLRAANDLCTCGSFCMRSCTVCHSTTWQSHDCVKQLALQVFPPSLLINVDPELSQRVAARNPGKFIASPSVLSQRVEEAIDWMEEHNMPLQPWQATAFRAIMAARKDGKDVVIVSPSVLHPQRGYRRS